MTRLSSVFYPPELVDKARANIRRDAWAAGLRDRAVEAAQPWMRMSDDELWSLMFGSALKRSWMVWSNGHCPACQQGVPMYTWEIDALKQPWKLRCPHCGELFPKNDFQAFHRSGLDEHGVFDPARADRSLLFNAEHRDPSDPLHRFGVDDGDGYSDGGNRWWFVATYLIYGQWKQLVWGGISKLSVAYLLTGDPVYAHKAGVLLDRVADLYPAFDFKTQGYVYERPADAGYVSTWHDACEETRELALAYDRVVDGLRRDAGLARFLADQARQHGIAQPKTTGDDVCRNIERGILQDALNNAHKIRSNYPRTEIAQCVIQAVLGWPDNRDQVYGLIDPMLAQATAVDGVTGEKGLAGYSAFTIQGLALFLALFGQIEPGFLAEMLQRHPGLRQTYRFHIDTWCWQKVRGPDRRIKVIAYYPQAGDTGAYAEKADQYVGVLFYTDHGVGSSEQLLSFGPSMFSFLWQLYRLTGDAAYAQVMVRANGDSVKGLPYDLFADNAPAFQRAAQEVIDQEGAAPAVASVNKQDWHLAILRSNSAAAWLKYDTGLRHGHTDGLNLGLFAKGLDLMPDFGYPPVHRGGWSGPNFDWYIGTLSHNTVIVDGKHQIRDVAGRTTLWAAGGCLQAIRVDAPDLYGIERYERTLALISVSEQDAYLLDVFRLAGGNDHAKLMHSHFGRIATAGLALGDATPDSPYPGYLMRNFRGDPSPQPGWSVDWAIEDRYHYLPPGPDPHLRYTDFTWDAQVWVAEAWVSIGGFNANDEAWIPRIMVRRARDVAGDVASDVAGAKQRDVSPGNPVPAPAASPLRSTFVGVIEPYDARPIIAGARRLALDDAGQHVALEIQLADGRRDIVVALDAAAVSRSLTRKACGFDFDGDLCLVRYDAAGHVQRVISHGGHLEL